MARGILLTRPVDPHHTASPVLPNPDQVIQAPGVVLHNAVAVNHCVAQHPSELRLSLRAVAAQAVDQHGDFVAGLVRQVGNDFEGHFFGDLVGRQHFDFFSAGLAMVAHRIFHFVFGQGKGR